MAVQQGYDGWGTKGGESIDGKKIEDVNLKNYYLSDAEIDAIIDIFYYNATYYYDVLESSMQSFLFKRMVGMQCAYHLEMSEDGNKRITKRVPCSAPINISNGFVSYDYQYNSSGKCTSRDYTLIPERFMSAANSCVNNFDMELYLTLLSELPASDDQYEFFMQPCFESMVPMSSSCTDERKCKSIGIYYNTNIKDDKDDSGSVSDDSEGGFIKYDGETFKVPYYSVSGADRALYPVGDDGRGYGLYQIRNTTLRSGAQSDGLSEEQIEYVLNNWSLSTKTAKNCILWDTAEHRASTAEALYEYQEEYNTSIMFVLAVLQTEGACRGTYANKYYNFFNYKAAKGQSVIPSSNGFRDYKADYGDPYSSFIAQMNKFATLWFEKRGMTSYYLMNWKGYDGKNVGSITTAYCRYDDDPSMPWASGSWWNSYRLTSAGKGWINTSASVRQSLENLVKEGYPDWEPSPFNMTEGELHKSFGKELLEWVGGFFKKDDADGGDEE